MSTEVVAWDLETCLIDAGLLAPPMVCMTTCGEDFIPQIYHTKDRDCEEALVEILTNKITCGVNIAFDMGCAAARFPHLLPLMFTAYFEDRVEDCRLRQRLIDLAQNSLNGYKDSKGVFHRYTYSLDALNQRYSFGALDKTTWRLRYNELISTPLDQWEPGARDYALADALATRRVYGAQTQYTDFLLDSPAQARAAFALHLASCRGIVTDGAACDKFIAHTQTEIDRARQLLADNKIVRETGSKDTKAAKQFMLQALIDLTDESCTTLELETALRVEAEAQSIKTQKFPPQSLEVLGIEVPITKTGGIRLDAEACRDSGNEVLRAYATYTSSNTMMELAHLLKQGTRVPLQTSFETLLETGRIASRAPMKPMIGGNFLNIRTARGLRECMIPRPGFVWCSIDGNFAELCAWAQVYHWLFGKNPMADAINERRDPHCILGAQLMGINYDEMVARKKEGDYKKARDHSKGGNFGFLANMGPKKYAATVNKKAKKPSDRITVEFASVLKQKFVRTWEAAPYFDWGRDLTSDTGSATLRQFVSGRVRGHCNYTQLLNSPFQGLIADALKASLLPISHECYVDRSSPLFGSRLLLHLYDEHILELREENAHEAAYRARDIMMEVANSDYLPDVNLTGEPALSRCWSKAADTYLVDGRLRCWEESPAYAEMMKKEDMVVV